MRTRTLLATALLLLATSPLWAEGTHIWTQSKYEEFEKGTAQGVAISRDGGLELAPAFRPVVTTPSSFVWAIAADAAGNAYLSAGAPARVYRVAPDGHCTIIFEPQELQVQSLALGPGGVLYAATSPDGRVYRIVRRSEAPAPERGKKPASEGGERAETKGSGPAEPKSVGTANADAVPTTVDPAWTAAVFFEPKSKYIWALAVDREGRLYVATGDRGEIFRVAPDGQGSVFFKSDEAHIRALAFDPAGNLIAGSAGSGLIYRISPAGQAFVLYSAPKKEISALAVDKNGNIYAAGLGEKRAPTTGYPAPTPPVVLSTPVVTATVPAPGAPAAPAASAAPVATPTAVPALLLATPLGSEVYRLAADGSPRRLWSSRDEAVYALGFDAHGQLLAGTGNHGRIYRIADEQRFTNLVKASATQIMGFAPAPGGGVYVATANLGKLFLLGRAPAEEGTYTSDVYDARIFSRWGRAEVRAEGSYELWMRSGNVDNPNRSWSPWQRVDVARGVAPAVPPARFLQWKAVLRPATPSPVIHSVRLNYLPKNVAPVLDDVQVQVGGDAGAVAAAPTAGPSPTSLPAVSIPHVAPSSSAAPERGLVTLRWTAHDDNDDRLVFSIYYRGDDETRWHLLRSKLTARFYTFEAGLLPDGGYTLKVVASDAPSHSPEEALTDERESPHFEIATTPPRLDDLHAAVEDGLLHVTFRASANFAPIRRAEYAVDAGEWQYVEPVGQLSDALVENYDFSAPLPGATLPAPAVAKPAARPAKRATESAAREASSSPSSAPAATEHLVVVRVWDRFNNLASAKLVVQTPSAEASGAR